jgi:hypothetical protein
MLLSSNTTNRGDTPLLLEIESWFNSYAQKGDCRGVQPQHIFVPSPSELNWQCMDVEAVRIILPTGDFYQMQRSHHVLLLFQ